MYRIVLYILLFFPAILSASPVEISGSAAFFANEPISIFRYKNQLTKEKLLIKSQIIAANGNFNLKFEITEPEIVVLKIEMRELEFHVHNGTIIRLQFLPFNDADNQRINMPYKIQYEIIEQNIAPDSIYQIIQDDFAQEQLKINRNTSKADLYDGFFTYTDSIYNNFISNDSLFFRFYTYFKARAYLQTNISKSTLIEQYIVSNPVLYQSQEYIYFFKSTMIPRVDHILLKHQNELELAKKEYQVYTKVSEILALDSLLKNNQIRDLALLLYTKSRASNHFFDINTKDAIIGQLANFSSFPIHQETARYYQNKKNTLKNGAEAPNFSLQDINGHNVSLNSYRSKPVYLGFIHSHSRTCQNNLLVIEKLKKNYRKMQFLIVVVDRDTSELESLIPQSSNLTFVYLNRDYSALEQYEIWNFPVYYLIDKHGYFMQSPAKFPEEMFPTFEKMFARKSRYRR